MACAPEDVKSGKLLIRDQLTDDGTRPFADGDNEVYWASPDIKLSGGVDEGTARVGAANSVLVTVRNIFNQPLSSINLEVWVCNYTMGVSPASALASSNPGGAAMTGFLAGPLAAKGTAGDHQDVTVGPWTPTPADAALNGGHVCIAANCYGDTPADGAPLSAEANTFKFLCDTHHAQRNIAVREVSGIKQLDFNMLVGNPLPQNGRITFAEIEHTTGRRAFTAGLRGLLRSRPDVIYARILPQVPITGDRYQKFSRAMLQEERDIEPAGDDVHHEFEHYIDAQARNFGLPATRKRFFIAVDAQLFVPLHFARRQPSDFTMVSDSFGTGRNLRFDLGEGQLTQINISVALQQQDQPGDMHALDLVQRTPEGDVVGGARLIVVVR